MSCIYFTGYAFRAPFRIANLSGHLSTWKMRVRSWSEFFLPSYTRWAQSILMSLPFSEGIHLERLALRKPAASEPSAPSGNPTSRTLFLLLLSSMSVIFSVSCSSWFLKFVTVLLSSRAAAWTESTRSHVCWLAFQTSAFSSFTESLVVCIFKCRTQSAGVSAESIASLTVEAKTESRVLCCSLSASLILLAIAAARSSGDGGIFEFFLYWRLFTLSFPVVLDCWGTHNGLSKEWFKIYWQDIYNFWQSEQSEGLCVHCCRRVTSSLHVLSWAGGPCGQDFSPSRHSVLPIDRSQRAWLTSDLTNQNAEIMRIRCYPPSCPTVTAGLHRNPC